MAAHGALAKKRKDLTGRLDLLEMERDRAARERDAGVLRCSWLEQQCRLLEAVAAQAAASGGRGSKENGRGGRAGAGDCSPVKAHRRPIVLSGGSSFSD